MLGVLGVCEWSSWGTINRYALIDTRKRVFSCSRSQQRQQFQQQSDVLCEVCVVRSVVSERALKREHTQAEVLVLRV